MVATLTPAPLTSVVHNGVSTAFSQLAAISTPGVSLRRKWMPLSGAAGCKVMLTLTPLCRPIPEQWMEFLSVR